MLETPYTRRLLSPTLLALVLGCFFLPFATVSCGERRATFTGAQLAAGAVPDSGTGLADEIEHGGQFYALLALAATTAALVFAAIRSPSAPAFFLSELAFLALCWAYVEGNLELAEIDVHAGYLLALGLLIASLVVHSPALRSRGLWAAVAAGIPGMLHPLVLIVAVLITAVIYAVVEAMRSRSNQELRPPSDVHTIGKNDSSMDVSPTRR
jgi:hypothetical protein